jgi:hypothetical protein
MRKFLIMAAIGVWGLATGLAWAQKGTGPRRLTPVIPSAQQKEAAHPQIAWGGTITPATVTLTSSNPNGTATATGTVSFDVVPTTGNSFTVSAKAAAANFTGCNTPAAGSVTVACSAPSGVTCAASAPLTSTGNGTTVATGTGNHIPASFTVTFTFQDAWNYQVGSGCTLTVDWIETE